MSSIQIFLWCRILTLVVLPSSSLIDQLVNYILTDYQPLLQVMDTKFINNTAQSSGSAMYVNECTAMSLYRCVFIERFVSTQHHPALNCAILSLSAGPAKSSAPTFKLADCRIQSAIPNAHMLLSVTGSTTINNTSVVCESEGFSLHHSSVPDAGYQLQQVSDIVVWKITILFSFSSLIIVTVF